VAELFAIALVPRSVVPLIAILALETYFAFRLDWHSFPGKSSPRLLLARWLFSLLVPWVVAWKQIEGLLTGKNRPNRQNTEQVTGSSR
jgi:hypothetical protein